MVVIADKERQICSSESGNLPGTAGKHHSPSCPLHVRSTVITISKNQFLPDLDL